MVIEPAFLASIAAVVAVIVISLAEWLHRFKVARVAHLAFGKNGRPRAWVVVAPAVRVCAAAAIAWGLVLLYLMEPVVIEKEPSQEASKHLLVCLDASPSMFVEDSGPDGKTKRAVWAGAVIQAILDRLDTETTRVTVFAVYTKSIPVIEDTFDMNVVRNVLDGLPLYSAFEAGPTKLSSGVNDALTYARQWKANSATLLIVSDGDSEELVQVRSIPPAIADTIVVGVGDPVRPTMIAGHRSTQDVQSLKLLATKLKGVYHQGNNKNLPSAIIDKLTMIRPRIGEGIGLREMALVCIALGGVGLGLIGPALLIYGKYHREHPVRIPRSTNSTHSTAPSSSPTSWIEKGVL
jgi:Ca-activated chloride channel family protein